MKKLEEALDPKLVDSYTGAGGKEYSYLETNEVINQHNRIFGHGNWYYRVKAGPTLCQVEHVDGDTGAIRSGTSITRRLWRCTSSTARCSATRGSALSIR